MHEHHTSVLECEAQRSIGSGFLDLGLLHPEMVRGASYTAGNRTIVGLPGKPDM
jgi:hypothetical protein